MRHLKHYRIASTIIWVFSFLIYGQYTYAQELPIEDNTNIHQSISDWNFVKSTRDQDSGVNSRSNCAGFILDFFITDSTVLLQAVIAAGVPPYSFEWSTGETNTQIVVPLSSSEVYCVTITDDDDCEIIACYDGLNVEDCQVDIYQFSTNNGYLLQPSAVGVPPIRYNWSNGDVTLNTLVTQAGVYCLTITDSEDCTAEACIEVENDWVGDCDYDISLVYNEDSTAVTLDVIDFNEVGFDTYRLNGRVVFLPMTIEHQGDYTFMASRSEGACFVSKDIFIDFGRTCEAEPSISVETQIGQNILTAQLSGDSDDLSYYWTNFFWEEETITATNNTTYCVEIKDNGEGCFYYTCVGNVINDAQLYGSIKDQDNNSYSGMVYIYQLRPEGPVLADSVEATANLIFSTYITRQYDHVLRIQPYPVGDRTFAPSYYRETLEWDEADIIQSTQVSLNGVNIFVFEIHDTEGDGLISGGLSGANNLMDIDLGDNGNRGANQHLAGHDVLLYSIDEDAVVGHQKTDIEGKFLFGNLALGHYRVMLTRPAMSTVAIEVTLTEDNPHNGDADIVLSQSEEHLSDLVHAFPNPVGNRLNLDFTGVNEPIHRIDIYDIQGKIVHSESVQTPNAGILRIDVSRLRSGLFIASVITEKRQGVVKFVKE